MKVIGLTDIKLANSKYSKKMTVSHKKNRSNIKTGPEGIEPTTSGFPYWIEGRCSNPS